MPEHHLTGDRWVLIMCNGGHDGVCNEDYSPGNADDLPCDYALIMRIRHWQHWYNSFANDVCAGIRPADVDAFSEAGASIASAVKQALPHWTVFYFHLARYFEAPEGYKRLGFTRSFKWEISLPSDYVAAAKAPKPEAETPVAIALRERWLMIQWDYRSRVVFNSLGLAFDPGDLPMAPDIIERLRQWPARFVKAPQTPKSLPTIADLPGFAAEGLAVARAVKKALPDWAVYYSNIYRQEAGRRGKLPSGTPYEFEILAGNRLRPWQGLTHAFGPSDLPDDPEPSFEAERWVRVMCDHGGGAVVWHRDGCQGNPNDLPIPPELVARLKAWQALFEKLWDSDDGATPIADITGFCAEGIAIAHAVKQALPEWTVIYFDEAIWEACRLGKLDSDVACEYEILLSG